MKLSVDQFLMEYYPSGETVEVDANALQKVFREYREMQFLIKELENQLETKQIILDALREKHNRIHDYIDIKG